MTNSHNTTVDLPLLLVRMQPTSGSNDDILMPQLSKLFFLVPTYLFTYLFTMMPFEPLVLVPVHHKAWLDNCTTHSLCCLLRPRSHAVAMSLRDTLGARL
jgi:hypothetical protein